MAADAVVKFADYGYSLLKSVKSVVRRMMKRHPCEMKVAGSGRLEKRLYHLCGRINPVLCGWIKAGGTGTLLVLLTLLAQPGDISAQRSLYQDIKANEVGDIITVILMENISGSSSSDARSSSNAGGSASGSVSGNFLPFEPVFGSDVNVDYGSDESNLANQGQLLEGNMSVQIIEVSDRGDLVVEGNRVTEINGEIHEMNLTGIVRPSDVDSRNQVLSYRVADANIKYQKQGGVEDLKKRRGFIRRVVFTGVGVLLGAAILAREL